MKKQLHTLIMGIFTLIAIYLYYLSAAPLPSNRLIVKETSTINIQLQEKQALKYLNHLRIGAGLIPFKSHPQLNQAARNHANYLTNHFTFGHKEEKKHKDFTGEFASSRVLHAGYASPQVIENVSTYNPDYKTSIDGLFSAIYHRLAFLDFRSDAIGIGISQNPHKKSQTAFVYDMSVDNLNELYKVDNNITSSKIQKILNENKKNNNSVVIYPFHQQQEVPPAFFDELPDPLPEHKVSGFPISISFNSIYHKEVKLLKFKLYNDKGEELNNTLIFDHNSDPHRRLEKLDFVLFPLDRLAWSSRYHIHFLAIVDKKKFTKKWSFTTKKFNIPLHTIKKQYSSITIKEQESSILYFPPTSKNDLLSDISYPANIDIEFIDKNTIKLTALAYLRDHQTIRIGEHLLRLTIER